MPENTHIVGYARTKMGHEDYLQRVTQYIKLPNDETKEQLEKFKSITSYQSGLYDDDASWQQLNEYIAQSETERNIPSGKRHRVFYMALPPSVFVPVAKCLKKNAYTPEGQTRVVVEKPFGMDTESSNQLGRELGALFREEEVRKHACS